MKNKRKYSLHATHYNPDVPNKYRSLQYLGQIWQREYCKCLTKKISKTEGICDKEIKYKSIVKILVLKTTTFPSVHRTTFGTRIDTWQWHGSQMRSDIVATTAKTGTAYGSPG